MTLPPAADATLTRNPLLVAWDTPFGLPPFAAIEPAHFAPAFEQAMAAHREDIAALTHQAAEPDFDNTLAALDGSGRLLSRVESVFWNLCSSETSPALQAVEREFSPRLAAHHAAIYLDEALFRRVEAVRARRDALGLSPEQSRLLDRVHLDFVRAGAQLSGEPRARFAQMAERLATLHTQFSQNVLADEAAYQLPLHDEADLAGLPDFVRAAARQAAGERGLAGSAVITLSRSLIVPFLTFSSRRDLREQAWRAWVSRGEQAGERDNRPVIAEILRLRHAQAALLGDASYADHALADTMAGTQAAVHGLLQQVWRPALAVAERDRAELLAIARDDGLEALQDWDWRYYAEKVRLARFDVDEALVKPYFPLERMVEAAFDCAHRLFGIRFVRRDDLAAYHADVQVYEVREDGASDAPPLGVFLHDNFARPTKRSGAWMGSYRAQRRERAAAGDGTARVPPIVVNNNNFAKGAPGEATLLSFDDAQTLFHEFGHGLHGLLSDVGFERLAGTNVLRDFVELPSQLFEHWLAEPQVMKRHARHHASGEPIPDALIDKLRAARCFNQAYETLRYTASAFVDLAAHARVHADGDAFDASAFETDELRRIGLPEAIGMNHRLVHFQHLFAGSGYAAGYYVYLWAEVLDADGYDAFTEAGDPFDPALAQRLREFIYAAGDSREPGAAYRAFRGRDATVQPMLRERGLLPA